MGELCKFRKKQKQMQYSTLQMGRININRRHGENSLLSIDRPILRTVCIDRFTDVYDGGYQYLASLVPICVDGDKRHLTQRRKSVIQKQNSVNLNSV